MSNIKIFWVVLRVGTVTNRRFSPDLVRVEFPVNGLVSLWQRYLRTEGAKVPCWSTCGGTCSVNYLNWLRIKLWLFYMTMSNIIKRLSKSSSSRSIRSNDSSASSSDNSAHTSLTQSIVNSQEINIA